MTYQLTTLKNGLRVATETMADIPSIALHVAVGNGSRYEPAPLNGISHFLEHMAFKGTKRRNAQQIAEEVDAVGGYLNAATDREHTVYHTKFLMEDTRLAVDIAADILQHSIFDKDEIARECMVIEQEIAQSQDTPDDIIFDYFMNTAYADQPLGRNILGTPATIQTFRGETFRSYLGQHYTASNMAVAAVGNLSHEALVAEVAAAFNSLPAAEAAAKEPLRYTGGTACITRELEQVNVVLGLPGFSYHHPDYYTMQLLSVILGGGMSSRLFQEVREKRGLAYSIQSFASSYADGGIFGIFAGTSAEQLPELTAVLCEELLKLTDTISDAEIKRGKAQLKASQLMGQESASNRAEELVRNVMVYGRHIPTDELVEKITHITKADLTSLAGKMISGAMPTIAAIGDVKGMMDAEEIAARLKG